MIPGMGQYIRKVMGWCPACKKMAPQTKKSCYFGNMAPISGKTENIPEFQTSNVVFPANSTLSYFLCYIGFSLLIRYPGDIALFLAGLLLLNTCYYFLFLKTFEAAVLVDRFGVHLQVFRLKNFEIPYEEIESLSSCKLEKRSKKMSLILVIGGIAICGFVVYMAAVEGELKALLLLISLFPFLLFMERKQKTRLLDLNTRLHIKTRHKKWYEWAPCYSIITDEASAARLKSFIERHLERR